MIVIVIVITIAVAMAIVIFIIFITKLRYKIIIVFVTLHSRHELTDTYTEYCICHVAGPICRLLYS